LKRSTKVFAAEVIRNLLGSAIIKSIRGVLHVCC